MSKRVTLKDVAKEANVSVMTVSNVINKNFYHVRDETRERVENAIKTLGYRIDLTGRALRLSRRFTVGMLVVDPNPSFIADAFTTNLIAGLGNHLSRRGYGLLLQGTTSRELEASLVLRHELVDGICVFCSGSQRQRLGIYETLARLREPLIIFQDDMAPDLHDAMRVRQDDAAGSALLAARLLETGCRTAVFLSTKQQWPAFEARLKGARAEFAKKKGVRLTTLRAPEADFTSIQREIARYVEEHGLPDAVMGGNDQIAVAVQYWLIDNNHRVPEDVRVTGFNAFEFARFARPALLTAESPAYQLGEAAAAALLERFENKIFRQSEIVLPVRMVEGDSA